MTDYNLSGLNTRSFEQLTQAIAAKVFGPNVIIFGDGPDGGREATFEGIVPYPSKEQPWNGYGVVQAKFLQRPQGAPVDGEWALEQLRAELTKYAWSPEAARPRKGRGKQKAPKHARRVPEYYVFVTNAVLTPVEEGGSKDKARAILAEFKKDKGLKDFDIWDYDKICAYLDDFEGIRHSYEGFITTGDVLARVMEWLRPQRPNFEQVIYKFLQSELIADQYANLEQAGRATEEKVPIARVFVDLPAYDEQLNAPPDESGSAASNLPSGFVAEVIETAKTKLDPVSVKASMLSLDDLLRPSSPHLGGRLVLVGGPGQGKTTLSQFTCQLFRASILKERANWVPVREVEDILQLIETQCLSEGIQLPTARRFPLRIVLSDFAKELATPEPNRVSSVLSYVAARIKKRTDEEVTPADLRLWLKNYPWVVIFDGLDEVPASSNRDDVLKAIQSFRVEINESSADVLIVATTRPQGYNEDFSPTVYSHKWLAPLSITRALHYARRLIEIRYSADKDRQERISARLERAAHTEATARLMRSPLQVTIMTTLIGTRGQPPQERWGLFSEYYKVIYQREMERDIPASDILRAYRSDIDRIHNRVGLILQAKSERSGETDARLSRQDFASVVSDRLSEEGHEGAERDALEHQITEAATDRLVFLVGLQEDLIGFEIRSLQEFMAAEALMDGGEEIVRRRLSEIAPISNWRNVFLFAAGKCFAERQEIRDTIHTLCAELNDSVGDEVSSATLEGSHLAMDLLEEGVVRTQPKFTKLFTRLALRALNLPPSRAQTRLAALYDNSHESLYKEELTQRLESLDTHRTLGAWACLGRLIASDIGWARDVADQYWPAEEERKLDVLRVTGDANSASWKLRRLIETVPNLHPRAVVITRRTHETDRAIFPSVKSSASPKWLRAVESLARRQLTLSDELRAPIKFINTTDGILSLTVYKTMDDVAEWADGLLQLPSEAHDGWRPILAAARFLANPTRETLSRELRLLSEANDFEEIKNSGVSLPWVMSACVGVSNNSEDLKHLARRAEDKELGDEKDWEAAEKRWAMDGIGPDDVEYVCDERLPFDSDIAERGFPFAAVNSWSVSEWKESAYLLELLKLHERLEPCQVRRQLASWTLFVLSVGLRKRSRLASGQVKAANLKAITLTSKQLVALLEDVGHTKAHIYLTSLNAFTWRTTLDENWVELLDYLGRHIRLAGSTEPDQKLLTALSDAFVRYPERVGLLRVLSLLVLEKGTHTVPDELLDPELYSDPESRSAAVIARLAKQQLTTSEAELLARYMAEHTEENWGVEAVLHMVEVNRIPLGTVLDRLLVTLLRKLPSKKWQAAIKTIQALEASLKRRTSGLEENAVWIRLGLRPKLNSLVAGN